MLALQYISQCRTPDKLEGERAETVRVPTLTAETLNT